MVVTSHASGDNGIKRESHVTISHQELGFSVRELADICRRYCVKRLSVFGSAARGELKPDSDIDLLIEFQPGAPIGLFELENLNEELEKLLKRRVDLVTKDGLKERIRNEVLREAKPVYAA